MPVNDSKRKPKFENGSVVQHRASGERAVIVADLYVCKNSKHSIHLGGWYPDCVVEFAGTYRVSRSFDQPLSEVDESLLELVGR